MQKRNIIKYFSVSFLVVALVFSLTKSEALGDSTKAKSSDKIKSVVQRIAPGASIISVEKALLNGFWEVAVDNRGQKMVIYIDPEGEYVLAGSLIQVATRTNITKKKLEEINKADVSLIPLDDALVLGNPKAKHKVIVFNDPD